MIGIDLTTIYMNSISGKILRERFAGTILLIFYNIRKFHNRRIFEEK